MKVPMFRAIEDVVGPSPGSWTIQKRAGWRGRRWEYLTTCYGGKDRVQQVLDKLQNPDVLFPAGVYDARAHAESYP